MSKYLTLFKIKISEEMSYRFDFWVNVLAKILLILVYIAFWHAVFSQREVIGGFTLPLMIGYIILAQVMRELTITNLDYDITQDIKEGRIANFLVKPWNYINANLIRAASLSTLRFFVYIFVFVLLTQFFVSQLWPIFKIANILAFLIIIPFSAALMILFETMIGLLAFWFTETFIIRHMFVKSINFFSCMYLPLTLFPHLFQKILN